MADGVRFEKLGVQTASIVTSSFKASSDAMAKRLGMPGYRYVMIKHPLSSLNAEETMDRANVALGDVLSILGLAEKAEAPKPPAGS